MYGETFSGILRRLLEMHKRKKAASVKKSAAMSIFNDRSLSYANYGDAKALRPRRSINKMFKPQLRTNKSKSLLLAFNKQF